MVPPSVEDEDVGTLHFNDEEEVPSHLLKYWHQRYDIFSKYDDGIRLTNNAWFGVTPEPVAHQIATDIAHLAPPTKRILIDLFAGAGGNAIAFALSGRWDAIYAIERDPATLECGRHNAALYGVGAEITWIEGDCFKVIEEQLAEVCGEAVLFASPPWGGPEYVGRKIFDVEGMEPYGLGELYGGFGGRGGQVVLFLPRTANLNQLAGVVGEGEGRVLVRHYCMTGFSKGLCVFYGKWEDPTQDG
ncbi:hypothetical protein P152DRAFT_399432 [Eremomyces bilateralis CBS 781.70]|uniref:Trimethylguanosine synthase n=1 Tax=Eremomyces bilateralis CBS 781.70 TaxID=1392243 RepID=A0A6G1G020_9PEZI|nr:uncharacterized protein P152DRAFT_399432 [Eremomyces bilateralis CBS 781.70]KAF1811270.1 hypothetical protein P152DRAFT_399432 [Eremomyces bilateralis CBS 781.70]